VGGHTLAVRMGRDFGLCDLLKPHLSPALPRTGIGQEYWHVKFARMTSRASLISSALGKPAPDKTIGRCTNEREQNTAQSLGEVTTQRLNRNLLQHLTQKSIQGSHAISVGAKDNLTVL